MWRQEDEIQTLLRESAEGYLSTHHSSSRLRTCRRTDDGFDLRFWGQMAELGWTGILLPPEMGGSGLGLSPALTLAETFGKQLLPEPFVASAVIGGMVLAASEGHRAASLGSDLAAGRIVILLADQEQAGVFAPTMRPHTRASRKGSQFVLTGSKAFVPSWTPDCQLIVSAVLDGDLCLVNVAGSDPGIEVETRKMCDGTRTASLTFHALEFDDERILIRGDAAEQALACAVASGTLALSAQLEGLARHLHRMTADYVLQRVQFGRPLASLQSIRHTMADLHVEIELSAAAWRSAAAMMEKGMSIPALGSVSAAKARCSETALAVSRMAIQFHGAFGYTEEAAVGLFVNTALRWTSWLGNSRSHRRNALALHRQAEHA